MTDRPSEADFSSASLRRVSGYQAVVDFLRREMTLGRLRPGDRLPAERRLAEQLGVARETLRQAIRVLEGSGQVVVQRGAAGGTIVQEAVLDPANVRADVLARAPEIVELTEFRSAIESATATLAAERRTASDLEHMRSAQRELADATTKSESRIADTAFHLAIARSAGNSMLTAAVEDARVRMFEPVDLLSFHFITESSLAAHARILDAIERNDAAAAAAAMHDHISMTREEWDRLIVHADREPRA